MFWGRYYLSFIFTDLYHDRGTFGIWIHIFLAFVYRELRYGSPIMKGPLDLG